MQNEEIKKEPRHVFLIGAKSVGQYGGYETFVDHLTACHENVEGLQYHVACKASGDGAMDESKLSGVSQEKRDRKGNVVRFRYHNADVVKFSVPKIGPAVAVLYDRKAFTAAIRYAKQHGLESPVFYVMTCRIGPFIKGLKRKVQKIGGRFFLNPDGHEWKRSKWSAPVRSYWKRSEEQMVREADLVICDSRGIERYVQETYRKYQPETAFIAYGSDPEPSGIGNGDPAFRNWLDKNGLRPQEYYLIVGRFVPENNFETMIREFMKTETPKKLAVITNGNERFQAELEEKLHFSKDPRIVFTGTLYEPALLKKVREEAYAYLHGHSVGGTNPSLLEALGSTKLNLLFDVEFNREVAEDAALYWSSDEGNLASLIGRAEALTEEEREKYGEASVKRIRDHYSWEKIAGEYEKVFLGTAADDRR